MQQAAAGRAAIPTKHAPRHLAPSPCSSSSCPRALSLPARLCDPPAMAATTRSTSSAPKSRRSRQRCSPSAADGGNGSDDEDGRRKATAAAHGRCRQTIPPTNTNTTPPPPPPRALVLVNRATKYAVSLAVAVALCLSGATPRACWDVAGAVASSAANKALKRLLAHERPAGAPKADPGMPSSHANSLSFLAVTAALEIWRVGGGGGGGGWGAGASASAAAGVAVLSLGAFLSWLRVRLGFHTPEQVAAGCTFGAACALGWHALAPPALEALAGAAGSERAAGACLKGVAALAGAAFALGNARGGGWLADAKGLLS